MSRQEDHDHLVSRCVGCTQCRLRLQRRHAVVYRGCVPAPLMLIGEAPGVDEDARGQPFVGVSGTLLDKLLERAEVPVDNLYFCNAVKCRPPGNREPTSEELRACRPHLVDQILLVAPKRIVTLGRIATMAVTATRGPMGALLAREDLSCFWAPEIPVVPVYHPSYLLRRLNDITVRSEVQDTVARLRYAWREASGQAGHRNEVGSGDA